MSGGKAFSNVSGTKLGELIGTFTSERKLWMRAPSFQNKHDQMQAEGQKTFPSETFRAQCGAAIQENTLVFVMLI